VLAVPTYSDLHYFFFMFAVVSGTEPWLIMGVVAVHTLVAFAELQKTTVSFVVSVCPSVRMEKLSSHWTGLYETCSLSIFRKSVDKVQVILNLMAIITDTLHVWYLAEFCLDWEIFPTKVVEKIKTHILCSVRLFRTPCDEMMWRNVVRVRQAAFGNTAHVLCMLDNSGYTHTHGHSEINIYCFPNATMAKWARLSVTLYIHCMCC
jgi:hypothetical protein